MTDRDEHLVHPLLQTARGYLTDEDYVAVEATLREAVERAKDIESSNERLRAELKLAWEICRVNGWPDFAGPIDDTNLAPEETDRG